MHCIFCGVKYFLFSLLEFIVWNMCEIHKLILSLFRFISVYFLSLELTHTHTHTEHMQPNHTHSWAYWSKNCFVCLAQLTKCEQNRLRKQFKRLHWIGSHGQVRWVCRVRCAHHEGTLCGLQLVCKFLDCCCVVAAAACWCWCWCCWCCYRL